MYVRLLLNGLHKLLPFSGSPFLETECMKGVYHSTESLMYIEGLFCYTLPTSDMRWQRVTSYMSQLKHLNLRNLVS